MDEPTARAGLCGIDVGGSGCRAVVLNPATGKRGEASAQRRLMISGQGIVLPDLLDTIAKTCRQATAIAGVRPLSAVAVGMTGVLTLAADRHRLHELLNTRLGTPVSVIASDAYTSLLGALRGEPGGIVAAGTGVIGFGTDFTTTWRRVDGWGHILGDDGGGTWIGTQGLRAAFAAYDGRSGGSAALLDLMRTRFGTPEELTTQTYTRTDRAGLIASFVPDVLQAANSHDHIARTILAEAGRHLARTAAAVAAEPVPPRLSLIGGIIAAAPYLTDIIRNELQTTRPELQLVPAAGSSLDGALLLAHCATTPNGLIPDNNPFVTRHPIT